MLPLAARERRAGGDVRQAYGGRVGNDLIAGLFATGSCCPVGTCSRAGPAGADIDHGSDQVPEEHSVDALALRGDEGRGTLR